MLKESGADIMTKILLVYSKLRVVFQEVMISNSGGQCLRVYLYAHPKKVNSAKKNIFLWAWQIVSNLFSCNSAICNWICRWKGINNGSVQSLKLWTQTDIN